MRKIARCMGASPALIVRWIKACGAQVAQQLQQAVQAVETAVPDVIAMDAIDTFVHKNSNTPSYGLRIVADRVVLWRLSSAKGSPPPSPYRKVKALVPTIAGIGTDANSCYAVACTQEGVPAPHVVSKAQTHVLESANSRIRDNLAQSNRRSKRYSKSWQRLDVTLRLFFQYHHSNK